MATFQYKAIDTNGKSTAGTLSAADRNVAMRTLEKRRLRPVSLKSIESGKPPTPKPKSNGNRSSAKQRAQKQKTQKEGFLTKLFQKPTAEASDKITLTRKQIISFTEELSDMLEAGLQLEEALRTMENRQELGSLKGISQKLREQVRDGVSFSKALGHCSDSFSALYCNLAAAGEVSGSLGTILKRQVHYLKTVQKLQERIILAMVYPAFLIVGGIGVTIIMMVVLLPALTELVGKNNELPPSIQFMNDLNSFLATYWWIVITVVASIIGYFFYWKKQPDNRPNWDRIKLKLPLLGNVIMKRTLVQYLETMANLLNNGLPALRALQLTRNATVNLHIQGLLDEVSDQVADGRSLSRAMLKVGTFPSVLIDILNVGEQTGKMDQAMQKAAERYDREFDQSVQMLMSVISPIVILWIAVLVGNLIMLILSAMSDTINNLS